MRTINSLSNKMTDRTGKTQFIGEYEATFGRILVLMLDSAANQGDKTRACIKLANRIDEAIKQGHDELRDVDNDDYTLIKRLSDNLNMSAYIHNQILDLFDAMEETYKNKDKAPSV